MSTPNLEDLAWLRRVRDRIDREYAQPLDVESLARKATRAMAGIPPCVERGVTRPIRNREASATTVP